MNTTPVRALVVEDNPGDARLIVEMFKGAQIPHDVTIAGTLQDGINMAQQSNFNVILLDLSLPDSHGIETLTHLLDHVPRVPVVVLTGFTDERLGIEAVAVGAQDYLIKGDINAAILLRSIRYARERHKIEVADLALAALQERQRLARDLHDSVTQSLFSANVMAESSLIQWDRNPEKAYDLMQQVHRLTKGALAEMRVLLLELRSESLLDAPLHKLIQQLVDSVYGQKDVVIETDIATTPMLNAEQQLTFYRITQEALNNIFKYANPTVVNVVLACKDGNLHLQIRDNGDGFDLDQVDGNSLGLQIMRERAEKIGAILDIHSDLSQGTQISLTSTIAREHIKTL